MDLKRNQERAIELFSFAPMKQTFEMDLSYNEQGDAVFRMPYNQKFNHAFGGIHGGVLATLLDNAGWFSASIHYDTWISTIDLQIQYLKAIKKSDLKCIGKCVKAGKSIAFSQMELYGPNNIFVAKGAATFSISNQPIDRHELT